jgi:transposase InsO family protein
VGVRLRFGAIREHGSIAVIERLTLTLKQSIAWLTLVPLRRRAFLRALRYLATWYNRHRPHITLGGRRPDEVYHGLGPINCQPRFEPRANWPRSSPCAKPVTLVKGQPGARLEMDVQFSGGRRHLPVVSLRRAA